MKKVIISLLEIIYLKLEGFLWNVCLYVVQCIICCRELYQSFIVINLMNVFPVNCVSDENEVLNIKSMKQPTLSHKNVVCIQPNCICNSVFLSNVILMLWWNIYFIWITCTKQVARRAGVYCARTYWCYRLPTEKVSIQLNTVHKHEFQ